MTGATGSDINGDGKPDLLFQHAPSGTMYTWYMGGLNGIVLIGQSLLPSTTTNWGVVGKDDFTNDGKTDILWQDPTTTAVRLWAMDGPALLNETTIVAATGPWRIATTGDLDGDGEADILWQHASTNAIYVWLMNGTTIIGSGFIAGPTPTAGWKVVRSST
jgi:hypothetical protein